MTLIFDALDEMPHKTYQERYKTLTESVQTHEEAGNRFVFSCRLLDYDSSFQVSEIIIDRFDRKRMRTYLQKCAPGIAEALYKEIVNDKALEDMVSNPFFLHALTDVNLAAQVSRPLVLLTRGELLQRFAETLFTQDVEIKQAKHLASIDGGLATLRRFLSELAFALQERSDGRTSAHPDSLHDVWDHYPQWTQLLWIAHRARILGKSSESADSQVDIELPQDPPTKIEFMHHRLQEYFAAEQLGARLSRGEPVERYVEDIWWQETVILAIGIVPEPETIIERILVPRADVGSWYDQVMSRAVEEIAEAEDGNGAAPATGLVGR